MLSKVATHLPEGEGWIYEPKWDGFRALVFRDGSDLLLQSRDLKPLNRYFPELSEPLLRQLPQRCVLDGEIVIAGPKGLDFDPPLLRDPSGGPPYQAAGFADPRLMRRLRSAGTRRRGPARDAPSRAPPAPRAGL